MKYVGWDLGVPDPRCDGLDEAGSVLERWTFAHTGRVGGHHPPSAAARVMITVGEAGY